MKNPRKIRNKIRFLRRIERIYRKHLDDGESAKAKSAKAVLDSAIANARKQGIIYLPKGEE